MNSGDNTNKKLWDQQDGESDLWYGRFRQYLLMGFKRSVNAVFQQELEENGGKWRDEAYGSWYDYAKKYQWEKRAKLYDKHWIEEQDKIIAQEREVVLRTGFALDYKRIEVLNKLADKMVQWADDDSKVWLVKKQDITSENFSKHTEEEVFNAPMMSAISKYLDDIAKEKGERVKKQEIDVTNTNDQDVQELHKAIAEALQDYPEARIALAERIAKRE